MKKGKNLLPTSAVTAITELAITGNVIPIRWYQELRTSTKRSTPAHVAIQILADIVYWYRAVEVRDEATGQTKGQRRKFRADRLQVSYSRYMDLLGYSKSVVKRAFDFLVDRQCIVREFRTVRMDDGRPASNVMFVEPIPATIKKISVLETESEGDSSVYATPSYRQRMDGVAKSTPRIRESSRGTSGDYSPLHHPPEGGPLLASKRSQHTMSIEDQRREMARRDAEDHEAAIAATGTG